MIVSETASRPSVETPDFGQLTVDSLRQWCNLCDRFNEWQHHHIIRGHPTTQEQVDHRQWLKWLLRLTKLMYSTASDPEFPDRSVVELLETKVWQLEQAWKLLYRRFSPPEITAAETLLKEVFPDEPGT